MADDSDAFEYVSSDNRQSQVGSNDGSQRLRHKSSRQTFDTQRLDSGQRIDQLKFDTSRYATGKIDPHLLEQLQALKAAGNFSPPGTYDGKRLASGSVSGSSGGQVLHTKKSRSKLPMDWFDGPQGQQEYQFHGRDSSGDDDDVIPTAIVVKNIPFNVKREQLLEIITSLGIPMPYAFNYHFDNGVFRGLAFANFRTPEETSAVVVALNGYDVQGRKLRVEYKKVLPAAEKERIEREKAIKRLLADHAEKERQAEEERMMREMRDLSLYGGQRNQAELDLNDPETLDLYSKILLFKGDKTRGDEMVFPPSLPAALRRTVHLIAQKLGLSHYSIGEGDERHVVVTRNMGQARFSPPLVPTGQRTLRSQRSYHTLGRTGGQQREVSGVGGISGSNTFSPSSTTGGPVRKSLHSMKSMSDLQSASSSSAFATGLGNSLTQNGYGTSPLSSLSAATNPFGNNVIGSGRKSYNILNPIGSEQASGLTSGASPLPIRQPKGPEQGRNFSLPRRASAMGVSPDSQDEVQTQSSMPIEI